MNSLLGHISWKRFPLVAGANLGQTMLSIGEIGNNGPTALVTAGVHGDEGPWGAWAIRKLLMNTSRDELLGTLRIVPVSNPFAMEADARNAPFDVLDLNRQFPGDSMGSHTERLAALLTEHALKGIDTAIDLHGGGSWCVNAFAFQMPGGDEISRAFGAPFIVSAPDRTVTLTGYARSQGAVVAAVEMGGRSEFEEQWADRIAAGLRRALGIAGILTPTDDQPAQHSISVGTTTVLRPSQGGVFIPELRASSVGTVVSQGKVLGHLIDPVSQEIVETFTAPFERTAVLLLRPTMTRIEGGAMTYVLAEPLE
jgi:predicted deacylase